MKAEKASSVAVQASSLKASSFKPKPHISRLTLNFKFLKTDLSRCSPFVVASFGPSM
jgi:hypothetical protein